LDIFEFDAEVARPRIEHDVGLNTLFVDEPVCFDVKFHASDSIRSALPNLYEKFFVKVLFVPEAFMLQRKCLHRGRYFDIIHELTS
jgi:hypothetical protein